MKTHEEITQRNQEIAEKILASPDRYRGEDGKISYAKVQEEFNIGMNRSYRIKFHVEAELAKKAHKKS